MADIYKEVGSAQDYENKAHILRSLLHLVNVYEHVPGHDVRSLFHSFTLTFENFFQVDVLRRR